MSYQCLNPYYFVLIRAIQSTSSGRSGQERGRDFRRGLSVWDTLVQASPQTRHQFADADADADGGAWPGQARQEERGQRLSFIHQRAGRGPLRVWSVCQLACRCRIGRANRRKGILMPRPIIARSLAPRSTPPWPTPVMPRQPCHPPGGATPPSFLQPKHPPSPPPSHHLPTHLPWVSWSGCLSPDFRFPRCNVLIALLDILAIKTL